MSDEDSVPKVKCGECDKMVSCYYTCTGCDIYVCSAPGDDNCPKKHFDGDGNCRKGTDKEMVDHPNHYGGDDVYECIKVLRATMTPEEFRGFCIGNARKYLFRAGKKGDAAEDLDKAKWYLEYYQKHGGLDA